MRCSVSDLKSVHRLFHQTACVAWVVMVWWSRLTVCWGARRSDQEATYFSHASTEALFCCKLDLLDPEPAFCQYCSPAGAGARALPKFWMCTPRDGARFVGINQRVWFLFKAILSVTCMIKSGSKQAETVSQTGPKADFLPSTCTWIPPTWASLQSDHLLTFPSFACRFFSKLHLDFRLPIKLESRFSSKNLQCEHLVRRDLTGPL